MTRWSVYVQGNQIRAGVQLDLTETMQAEGHSVPPLVAGDKLALEYPNNDRKAGQVIEAAGHEATVEASGQRWRIRRATDADSVIPPARSTMRTVSWIVV